VRLTSGTRVGPYEVVALLGHGGMAEVYRARDTRLGREVALKMVAEALTGDGELLGRFEREARLAGSLNHPNVLAVHDVGLHEGSPFFVTELLEGQTLRERLARGPVPLGTALDWAVQMAQGLAAAHEHGIVHRDLKPENVFVTRDGHVKLLDFGIAKLVESARRRAPHGLMDATETPSGGATGTGRVIGTPGYMSPEQVRGDAVDARTDFFSLGAVLYELLGGQRAFPGGSLVESGHAILHAEPAPLPPEVPPAVAQVVRRCLEKEPQRRFQSARDLAFHLEVLRSPGTTAPTITGPRPAPALRRRRWVRLGLLGAVLAALAAGVLAGRASRHELGQPLVKPLLFRRGSILGARFAPDGKTVHFSASWGDGPPRVYTTAIDAPEVRAAGIEDAQLLAVSRSGELAVTLHPRFMWFDAGRGTLARVSSLGGTPRELATDVEYADWAPDGERLAVARFAGDVGTLEFPVGHVLFRSTGWVAFPRVSRSGDRVAFVNHPITGDNGGEAAVVDLSGHVEVRSRGWDQLLGLAWAPDGDDLWLSGSKYEEVPSLWVVDRDGRHRLIHRGLAGMRLDDVARDGRVLVTETDWRQHIELIRRSTGERQQLDWLDWSVLCCVSEDGKTVVFDENGGGVAGHSTIFLRKVDARSPVRLGAGRGLALSPDGQWVLAVRDEVPGKLWLLPTGPGESRSIDVPLQGRIASASFYPGGKRLALAGRERPDSRYLLYQLELEGPGARLLSPAMGIAAISSLPIAPDGSRLAALGQDGVVTVTGGNGGEPVRLTSLGPWYAPDGWTRDGALLSHGGQGLPAPVMRFDPVTAGLSLFTTLVPSDPAGVERITRVRVTPDGQTVVINYRRMRGGLFVLDWRERPR